MENIDIGNIIKDNKPIKDIVFMTTPDYRIVECGIISINQHYNYDQDGMNVVVTVFIDYPHIDGGINHTSALIQDIWLTTDEAKKAIEAKIANDILVKEQEINDLLSLKVGVDI